MTEPFDLDRFLPYQLNQVAEAISKAFQDRYRAHDLTRTQWRILAHLASADGLTARDIRLRIHEDKVSLSRGVVTLEARGLLRREPVETDRRAEALHLTESGRVLFVQLAELARAFEEELAHRFGRHLTETLSAMLVDIREDLAARHSG